MRNVNCDLTDIGGLSETCLHLKRQAASCIFVIPLARAASIFLKVRLPEDAELWNNLPNNHAQNSKRARLVFFVIRVSLLLLECSLNGHGIRRLPATNSKTIAFWKNTSVNLMEGSRMPIPGCHDR